MPKSMRLIVLMPRCKTKQTLPTKSYQNKTLSNFLKIKQLFKTSDKLTKRQIKQKLQTMLAK